MSTTKIAMNSNGSLKIKCHFKIKDKEGNIYSFGGR
jgi:hypothetical protein